MNSDNQTKLNENDNFVSEEDTEISLPPPAPNFETAQAVSVQPVIPVAPIPGEADNSFPQQPQVVYVAQPTVVQPNRGWGWIPAALALLVVAIIAGVFIGAELYKRSIYAESAAPYSTTDLPPDELNANENKSLKSGEENSLAGKTEIGSSGNLKSGEDKTESRQINSISTGFAPIQKTELKETGNDVAGAAENEGEQNNQEQAEAADSETQTKEENLAVKNNRQLQPDDEDAPPPPVQRKAKEFQPKKVENVKDTENIVPPQRNMQN